MIRTHDTKRFRQLFAADFRLDFIQRKFVFEHKFITYVKNVIMTELFLKTGRPSDDSALQEADHYLKDKYEDRRVIIARVRGNNTWEKTLKVITDIKLDCRLLNKEKRRLDYVKCHWEEEKSKEELNLGKIERKKRKQLSIEDKIKNINAKYDSVSNNIGSNRNCMEILLILEEIINNNHTNTMEEDEKDNNLMNKELIDKCITLKQANRIILFKEYDILNHINDYNGNEMYKYLINMDNYTNYIYSNNKFIEINRLINCGNILDSIEEKLRGFNQMEIDLNEQNLLDSTKILWNQFNLIDNILIKDFDFRNFITNSDFVIDKKENYLKWIQKGGFKAYNYDLNKMNETYNNLDIERINYIKISQELLDIYSKRMVHSTKIIFDNKNNLVLNAIESEDVLSNTKLKKDINNQKYYMNEETLKAKLLDEKIKLLNFKCNLINQSLQEKDCKIKDYEIYYNKLNVLWNYERENKELINKITKRFLADQLQSLDIAQATVRKNKGDDTLKLKVLVNTNQFKYIIIDAIKNLKNHDE